MRHTLSIFKRELTGVLRNARRLRLPSSSSCSSPAPSPSSSATSTVAGRRTWIPSSRGIPWLYLFLIPSISMRLWAEERKTGTIELLMTLPITLPQVILGKFLAAWCFAGIALAMTFPTWITVNYLGDPDNGAIIAGYLGSFLMAGGFLAIGSCISSVTKNQVIAFVITVVFCLFFLLADIPGSAEFFNSFAPAAVVDAITSFSFIAHFRGISRGLIDARDLIFFASLIFVFLFVNALVLEAKKAE